MPWDISEKLAFSLTLQYLRQPSQLDHSGADTQSAPKVFLTGVKIR